MTVFMRRTIIAHLDLDEFYVAVERIKDPSLKNKPVVVGGSPTGRGVVSSASYEARKYGIRSAMPMYQAMKLCPHLIRVGGKFREYSKYSSSVFGIVGEYSEFVERTGIDEGYIELTDSVVKLNKTALQLAEEIKQRIDKDVGLSVSFGIGSNKMMAKIASKHAKPNGIL
ncbi:DNA polymerase IV, partial [Candidatus Marinimicrobia bacterium MT.SAG.2]